MNKVKIGDFLIRVKETIEIEDEKEYKRVTIKTKNQGVFLRDKEKGINIGTKKQFLVREGQFLLSKIDARNGAFGIVSGELDNAIITGNFWTYDVDDKLLNIDWFNIFVSSKEFIGICDNASSGTTNRRYLDENKFLNYVINIPPKEEQDKFVQKFNKIYLKYSMIDIEISKQREMISKLRQSLLHEAVQGKLVAQDYNDEPANAFLERIKEEKIKKEKSLLSITKDEIPYELPKGWEWVRLSEVTSILRGSSPRPKGDKRYFSEVETSYNWITISDITNFTRYGTLYKTREYLTLEGSLKSTRVNKNEVIIAVSGSTTGKSCITGIDGYIYDGLAVIRLLSKEIHEKYVLLFIKQLYSFINKSKEGSAFPNINTDKLKKIIFPLPPLGEQSRIVQKVDQLMSLCDDLEKNIEQSKKDSELLIQSVLQDAFNDNGKENDETPFGDFIKQKRKDKGITITDMLKLLKDVKASEYSKIEEGLVIPEKLIVEKIAKALKFSDVEIKSFEKLKIKTKMDQYSNSDCEHNIAARRINKN